ncbi:MAG: glycosyltransferase family 2 protein, partial [Alphaproteobacteria bacterium]
DEIKKRPQVILHASEINLGYCTANNRLAADTDAPYILLLNPDTQMQAGCLARLVQSLDEAPANTAGVGPKLLLPTAEGEQARIDSAGMVLSKHNLSPYDRGHGEPDHGQYNAPGEYFGPSLACALLRREAVKALSIDGKPLDEDFFAYYEDVDFAWRAHRLGWHFFYEPRAVCLHHRGHPHAHGPTLAARAFVNRYLLLIANENGSGGWTYLLTLIPRELARLVWKSLTVKGFAVAWRMLAAGWHGAWAKRRRIAAMAGAIQ